MRWFRKAKQPPLPPRIFALPDGVRLYAIGDIHGRMDLLELLMQAINEDAQGFEGEEIIEIFLGDYVDRGPDSRAIIDFLITPPETGRKRICLRGNHEQSILDFLEDASMLRSWMQYGGLPTLDAYGVTIPPQVSENAATEMQFAFRANIPAEHVEFLNNLPFSFECGDYYFAHAGVRPELPLAGQSPHDLMWIRDAFLSHTDYFEKYIVHGHTPGQTPQLLPNRANLDVNDAPNPSLAALRIEGTQRDILQVSA